MANSSVFIVDKNVDYYDYFDKSTSKIKTKFKLNIKNGLNEKFGGLNNHFFL